MLEKNVILSFDFVADINGCKSTLFSVDAEKNKHYLFKFPNKLKVKQNNETISHDEVVEKKRIKRIETREKTREKKTFFSSRRRKMKLKKKQNQTNCLL